MTAEPGMRQRPMRATRGAARLATTIAALAVCAGVWTIMTNRTPTNLGVREGRLRPCPASPNCVCSFDTDPEHGTAPLRFSDPPEVALQRLRMVIAAMPRAKIRGDDGRYLHAEFRSLILRFVDDVEFLLDAEAGVIHVRSASRLGYSDLGVNRSRVENLRQRFESVDGL